MKHPVPDPPYLSRHTAVRNDGLCSEPVVLRGDADERGDGFHVRRIVQMCCSPQPGQPSRWWWCRPHPRDCVVRALRYTPTKRRGTQDERVVWRRPTPTRTATSTAPSCGPFDIPGRSVGALRTNGLWGGGLTPARTSTTAASSCGPFDTPRRSVGALRENGLCGNGPTATRTLTSAAPLCGPFDTLRRSVGALRENGLCGDGPTATRTLTSAAPLCGPFDTPRRSVGALRTNGLCGGALTPARASTTAAPLCGPFDLNLPPRETFA